MSFDWPLILAYHHIHPTNRSRYSMRVSDFERRLHGMLEGGFAALTLTDAIGAGPFGAADAPPKSFTITFDDGLESFGSLAFPVLQRLGLIEATTVFIPTAFVGEKNSWSEQPTTLQKLMPWSDIPEALMSWDRISELAGAGVSFQSHGHGHLAMNKLPYEDALADVRRSLELLGEHGIAARYFALPFGWHSEECKRAIRDCGLDAALSVKWGGHDRYEIRRIPVYGTDHAPTTRLKLSGRYFDAFDFAARLAGKKKYR